MTAIAVATSVAFAALFFTRPAASTPVSRQRVQLWQSSLQPVLAPGVRAVAAQVAQVAQVAIAPDGSSIVFADTASGQWMLMRKLRNASDATVMTGTEGASSPFFSPDGKWVAFLTNNFKLKKVPIDGGGAATLASDVAPDSRSGAWLDDNSMVYFAEGAAVKRLSADGGPSVALPDYKQGGTVASIVPLPGSKGILLSLCARNCAIISSVYAYSFATDSLRLLVPDAAGVWYAPTGQLLYTARDGGMYAADFDAVNMKLTSGPMSVIDGVDPMRFALSASGSALYTTDEKARTLNDLVWASRDGRQTAFDSSWVEHFEYPALSPDGRTLAVSVRARTTDLWRQRSDGTRQRLVTPGVVSWRPSWMPDGKSLVFTSVGDLAKDENDVAVYRAPADGSTKASPLQRADLGLWEAELSRDGAWMVVRKDVSGSRNIVMAR